MCGSVAASAAILWSTMSAAAEPTASATRDLSKLADGRQFAQAAEAENAGSDADGADLSGQVGTPVGQSPRSFDDLETAASGLNDVLAGARAKLEQLREATEIAAIAAQLRDELEASSEENNRLSKALTEAEVEQRSLELSQEQSKEQIAELTKVLEEARSEAGGLKQQLRQSREKTKLTDAARSAAEERADRAERQLAESREQNQSLVQEISTLKGKLTSVRRERDDGKIRIEGTRKERDDARQELDQIRLRIAGLLRSVLHADEETTESDAGQVIVPATRQLASEEDAVQGTYEILRPSNIRAEPRPDAERVDFGVAGDTVSVVRKVGDDNWFEVITKRGVSGFIFGDLIRPTT